MYHYRHLPRLRAWNAVACNDEFKQAFERYFNEDASATSQWKPRVDIKEQAERFVIYADVPGVEPRDIQIHADNGVLSLKGERSAGAAQENEGWSLRESRHGGFERRFDLPDNVDAECITATGKHGVLEISIPKKAQSTARRIQVN
jgi:HSP20 family protein